MFKFGYVLEIPIVGDFSPGLSPDPLDRIEVQRIGRKAQHLHPLPYVGIPRFLLVPYEAFRLPVPRRVVRHHQDPLSVCNPRPGKEFPVRFYCGLEIEPAGPCDEQPSSRWQDISAVGDVPPSCSGPDTWPGALPNPFGRNRRIKLEMHLILIDYLIIAAFPPGSQFFLNSLRSWPLHSPKDGYVCGPTSDMPNPRNILWHCLAERDTP